MQKELKMIIILAVAIFAVAGSIFFLGSEDALTGSTVILPEETPPPEPVPAIPRDPKPADAQSFSLRDTLEMDGYSIIVYNAESRNRVGEGASTPAQGTYIVLSLKVTNLNNREGYFPKNFLFLYDGEDIKYPVDEPATNTYGLAGLYNPVLRQGQEKVLKAVFDVPEEGSYEIRLSPADGPVFYSTLAL